MSKHHGSRKRGYPWPPSKAKCALYCIEGQYTTDRTLASLLRGRRMMRRLTEAMAAGVYAWAKVTEKALAPAVAACGAALAKFAAIMEEQKVKDTHEQLSAS